MMYRWATILLVIGMLAGRPLETLDRFTISPPSGAAEPVLVNKQELATAAEKREREIVAATQAAIEKYRKADATVRVVDAAGRPIPSVQVSIEQTAHEFLFGCNI